MSLPYFLLPQADRDIDEIADDLAGRAGLELGLAFLQEFYKACALLSTQPEMGWPAQAVTPSSRQLARSGSVSDLTSTSSFMRCPASALRYCAFSTGRGIGSAL